MKFVVFFIVLVFQTLLLRGQVDSVFNLNEINISDSRLKTISETGRVVLTDTAHRANASTLTDVLEQSSPVFLKDNGGCRLATISIRGTSASQNTLSWNGLSLNTPTLGLADLSLVPAFFIDDIAIQFGGNGSLNGNAAIGGAVHLNTAPKFNEGLRCPVLSGIASFNDNQQGIGVTYSNKIFFTRTAFFHHTAENNYKFINSYALNYSEREQQHASVKQNGVLQENYLMLKKDLFSLHCMYLDAGREIPPLMSSTLYQSEQYEKDKQLRLVAEWKHYEGKLQTLVRCGWLDDKIEYNDKLIQLDDKSRGQNLQSEAEVVYNSDRHHLQGGIVSNISNAHDNSILGDYVQGYPGNHSLSRSSVYISYGYKLKHALLATVSLRKEIEKEKDYPLLPALGLRYRLSREITFYANAAAVYRTPTLNDLYWSPGGNPFLKPEKGYQRDMRMQSHVESNYFSVDVDAGVFYMKINNWIQWVPDASNNYSPINIETVVSRGKELSGKINFQNANWKISSGGAMEYVLATNKFGFGNVNAADKQLVYTPIYKWLFTQSVSYKNTEVLFQLNYTGYRYTTNDNSSWLEPYDIANCTLSQTFSSAFVNVYISGSVNNIFNKSYEVIALRPMPGRWFRLSLLLNIVNKKQTHKL